MSDAKQRLIEEMRELNDKQEKLFSFIMNDTVDKKLPKEQHYMLRMQHIVMKLYLDILRLRLEVWEELS